MMRINLQQRHHDVEHRPNHEISRYPQIISRTFFQTRETTKVDRQLTTDEPQLEADGSPNRRSPAIPLTNQKTEMGIARMDLTDQHSDRTPDRLRSTLTARLPDHGAQGAHALFYQRYPEIVHGREVAVERGGHDPHLPGHLAQAQAGQAAIGKQT